MGEASGVMLADVLDQIIWVTAPDGQIEWLNRRWQEYTGLSFTETRKLGWQSLLHPEDLPACRDAWEQAQVTGQVFEREYRLRDAHGGYAWFLGRSVPFHDPDSNAVLHWVSSATDITERRMADSMARNAARVLNSVRDAYITLDRDFVLTYVNAEAARINKKTPEQMVGRTYWDEWPASMGTEYERQFRRAMAERTVVNFLERYYVPGEYDVWTDVTVYPAAEEDGGGLHLVYRDVSERVGEEHRHRFLADLTERTRFVADPEDLIWETVCAAGTFLDLARCLFADIDEANDRATIHRDWHQGDGISSVMGVWPVSLNADFQDDFRAGRTVAIADFRTDPRTADQYEKVYSRYGIRAALRVPVVRNGQWVALLSAHSLLPRDWSPADVSLLETLAERMWSALSEARLRQSEREQGERHARIAESLARSLLIQPDLMRFDGLEVHAHYEAARDEEQIGGDIYDAFALGDGRVALAVGDATGKGLAASTDAADIKFSLRAYLRMQSDDPDPEAALRQMNRHALDRQRLDGRTPNPGRMQAALLCLALAVLEPSTGDLRLSVASMEEPFILRGATGTLEPVRIAGPILGMVDDWSGRVARTRLDPGDTLLLFTDGLTEARPGKRGSAFFGVEGVAQAVSLALHAVRSPNAATIPLAAIGDAIVRAAKAHGGGAFTDDICLLLARRPTVP